MLAALMGTITVPNRGVAICRPIMFPAETVLEVATLKVILGQRSGRVQWNGGDEGQYRDQH